MRIRRFIIAVFILSSISIKAFDSNTQAKNFNRNPSTISGSFDEPKKIINENEKLRLKEFNQKIQKILLSSQLTN